jgi:hypothetical protein
LVPKPQFAIWCYREDGYCGWIGFAAGGAMVPWPYDSLEAAEAQAERLARSPDACGHSYKAFPSPGQIPYNEAVWKSWKGLREPPA